MKEIARGAEAVIYKKDNIILKDRIAKNYRIKEIDYKLRKFRTKREAKVIEKLQAINFPSPRLIKMSDFSIEMENIDGEKLVDIFERDALRFAAEIGRNVALMHKNNIIHGDLTTSNMILSSKDKQVYFIDFGLSFFSEKIEDKAVDLHLLRQALESKHYTVYQESYKEVLKHYSRNYSGAAAVIKRLELVEKRGRYKHKG